MHKHTAKLTVLKVSSRNGTNDGATHVGAVARGLVARVATTVVTVLNYLPVK